MSNIQFAQEIGLNLLQINAVQLNLDQPFTWASGWKSPIYCDNRRVLSHPKLRSKIITGLNLLAKQHFADADCIAGVATAGIPHGALIADKLDLPFVYVRSSAKEHGLGRMIEGEIPANAKVLLVEDLISTGKSSLKAVEAIRDAGFEVVGLIAVFTYGFEIAERAFAAANCPFYTLSNYDALIDAALEEGIFNKNQVEILKKWSKNPEKWL